MAKPRKQFRRTQSWSQKARKMVRSVGYLGASGLAAGCVLVPIYDGYKFSYGGQGGGIEGSSNFVQEAVYSATGYNMLTKKVDQNKVKEVLIRDGVMIGGAIVIREFMRRV
jgi:hypothetical protein